MAERTLSPEVIAQRAVRQARQQRDPRQPGQARTPMRISDAERKRRSEAMKELNRQQKAGVVSKGNMGKGRPRVKSATEHLAEVALEEAETIARVAKRAMRSANPVPHQIAGANLLLDAERERDKKRSRDIDDLSKLRGRDLSQRLAATLLARGTVDKVRQFIDAEYEELEDSVVEGLEEQAGAEPRALPTAEDDGSDEAAA